MAHLPLRHRPDHPGFRGWGERLHPPARHPPLTTALTVWALVGPWTAPPAATWAVMKPAVWAAAGNGIALLHTSLFRGGM
ncbi:hypothetical protein GCM10020000_87540 [Streptomyces olivoverticillatus]